MSDLVQRLRDDPGVKEIYEAADRIEALEAAMREIAEAHSIDGANAIARSALTQEQNK